MKSGTRRAMSTKELSDIYQVHPNTFRKWISKHKEAIGERCGLWTPKQVDTIRSILG